MPIHIQNQQKKIPLIPAQIHDIAKKILRREGVRQYELSIVFVTDRAMQILNRTYHHCDYPTDVLSFDWNQDLPPSKKRTAKKYKKNIDGEIIISTVTACRQARRFRTQPYQEIVLYLAHGILHLLGYDDHSAGERKVMRRKESELMDLLKLDLGQSHDS